MTVNLSPARVGPSPARVRHLRLRAPKNVSYDTRTPRQAPVFCVMRTGAVIGVRHRSRLRRRNMRVRNDVDKIRSLLITSAGESDHYGEMMKTFFRTEKAEVSLLADYTGMTASASGCRSRRAILRQTRRRRSAPSPKKVPLRAKVDGRTTTAAITRSKASPSTPGPTGPSRRFSICPRTRRAASRECCSYTGTRSSRRRFRRTRRSPSISRKTAMRCWRWISSAAASDKPQEHENLYMYMAGQTVQGLMVWDNMRAVDYLHDRREVDRPEAHRHNRLLRRRQPDGVHDRLRRAHRRVRAVSTPSACSTST